MDEFEQALFVHEHMSLIKQATKPAKIALMSLQLRLLKQFAVLLMTMWSTTQVNVVYY